MKHKFVLTSFWISESPQSGKNDPLSQLRRSALVVWYLIIVPRILWACAGQFMDVFHGFWQYRGGLPEESAPGSRTWGVPLERLYQVPDGFSGK